MYVVLCGLPTGSGIKLKIKKQKSRGSKLVVKEGHKSQIIGTLSDGVCPLAQDLTGRGWTFRMFTSKSRRWKKENTQGPVF